MKRNIVEIDVNKCNGCGLCVSQCHEGALEIVNGKAVLTSDVYCDGLGNCIGTCPRGAIRIVVKEASGFDFGKTNERLNKMGRKVLLVNPLAKGKADSVSHCSCPGAALRILPKAKGRKAADVGEGASSQLRQWPVQIRLLPVDAPFFGKAGLLISADCVPFAYPDFHHGLLGGKAVAIGCPKLDDCDYYAEKLTSIIQSNDIGSVTVAIMEVPCCRRMYAVVREALTNSGKDVNLRKVVVGIDGIVKEDRVEG